MVSKLLARPMPPAESRILTGTSTSSESVGVKAYSPLQPKAVEVRRQRERIGRIASFRLLAHKPREKPVEP